MPDLKAKFPCFENPIIELQNRITKLTESEAGPSEIEDLEGKRKKLVDEIYSNLNSYQKVQLARHPMRPHSLDYIEGIFDDFLELHGDRKFGDDEAVVGGLASLSGETFMVIGQQKGRTPEENLRRNYGMPHPEGYRKALRLMRLAEKFSIPVVSFIDTPGAYPGVKAEERGQAEAIASNLKEMMDLKTTVIVIVIGEGGSGGALGMAVGDKILMLEYSVYFVCTPEACSAILWKDSTMAETAAENLRLTAKDLLGLGVIDEIVPEPPGGAHWDYAGTCEIIKRRIKHHRGILKRVKTENLLERRYKKFRGMGVYSREKQK